MVEPEGLITEDIRNTIGPGQTVCDVDGKKVGSVDDVDRQTGYMMVLSNAFADKFLYIATGFRVYTTDGAELGLIREYDSVAGVMLVEKGVISRHDLALPPSVVDGVDRFSGDVYLAASQSDIQRRQHLEPVEVVLRAEDRGASDGHSA
jgi:hypothetical protein